MQRAINCTVMRGGTSKGLYFLATDLPEDQSTRDRILLAVMGSPDIRQIDGMGGAHPLTSKVAIVSRSEHAQADVDYLFLQVSVDQAQVSDSQNCGNLLAGVGPFALEQGLLEITGATTDVRIHMLNTDSFVVAKIQTPEREVEYQGDARIDGVPGTAAPVLLDFLDVAGSSCGALLPSGSNVDVIDGIEVSCIDNGMPVVILDARDFGLSGYEDPEVLEQDTDLKQKIESIRLQAGELMNLADVTHKTVPKMTLVAPARDGGIISTRTFIPHRVHEAIGVLGAVSVATACVVSGSVAHKVSEQNYKPGTHKLTVEHPTGAFVVEIEFDQEQEQIRVLRSALLRTARKLMQGQVFVATDNYEKP
tara:strand:- start:21662 stop:22753 length:1092 start_codon:yes stop_codon:yes gene_type:complete